MRYARFKAFCQSLRFRLTVWNTAVVLLTVVASLIAVHVGMRVALLRETDQYLAEDSYEISLAFREFYPDMPQIHEVMDRKATGHSQHQYFVQLLDPAGHLLWSGRYTPTLSRPITRLADQFSLQNVDNFRVAQRRVSVEDSPAYVVRIGVSMHQLNEDVNRLSRLVILVGGVMLLLSPFGGYWLAGRATRPLAQMNAMAATLRPDKVDERMPTRETGDELDQFSRTINGLLDRIAEYINQNRQFVANAAHELRSPLTAIQSSVEVTLNSQRTAEEYQELLAEVVEQCSDLRILVNQLLLLAESTAESPAGHLEPVALDQLARRAIEMFRDAAEEQGVRLYADHLDEVTLPGQESRLRQVINNLIDNGIKFNRPGGEVVLSIRNRGVSDEVELQIRDTGIGIPAEDLQHIFKRFYRGDKSRHRDHHSSGNGLGLSICEAIINAHGGRVEVTSTLGESTCFRVWLKKSQDGTDR